MNTTEKFIQSTCKAILHSCSELQRANDALQERVIALTRLSALRADMVQMADNERVEGIESRLKMESEVLALRQRAELAEATSARLEQQLLKATQDQLKVRRESKLKLVLQEDDSQDSSAEATGENKARMQQKTRVKAVAVATTTSTTPREKTRTGQDECVRVLASAKDVAASVGADTTAGSRARVRPATTAQARVGAAANTVSTRARVRPATTARARVGATANTVSTRARVESTAAARAIIAATAGTGASRMSSARKQTRVKTGGRRIALGNGC